MTEEEFESGYKESIFYVDKQFKSEFKTDAQSK
jgi:hypothetical protein